MSEACVEAATGDATTMDTSAPLLVPCYSIVVNWGLGKASQRCTAHLLGGVDPDQTCAVQDLRPSLEYESHPECRKSLTCVRRLICGKNNYCSNISRV